MPQDPLADFDLEILQFLESADVDPSLVQLNTPPEREFGERSTNVAFRLAKERRAPPQRITADIAARFQPGQHRFISSVEPAGAGFLNFRMNYETFVPHAITGVRESGSLFGRRPGRASKRVVVEHTSVNPNKEWHIGHVRNVVLGDVVSRLLRLAGDKVQVQNYIDDTGMQAAQAIVGLVDFPEEQRPNEKFDHYAGRLYVKVAAELGAEKELRRNLDEIDRHHGQASESDSVVGKSESVRARLENIERLKKRVMQAMRALEDGEYHASTERILNAQLETAYRLGAFYDLLAWESDLVGSRTLDQAIQCLKGSPKVYQAVQGRYAGALVIETGRAPSPDEEVKAEVLVRSNGIPTYVGKDIAYHMWKFRLVPDRLHYAEYCRQPNGEVLWSTTLHGAERSEDVPDRIVNVIAVNQSQAQDAVREGLRAAGFEEAAENLFHLAYGLVSTAEGKISGRKGTTVSGDAVIDQAVRVALDRVTEKRSQDLTTEEMAAIAEAVGVGALRYFMVQYNPLRDIVFDVSDVVSYDGNTGLYVQYALVRMFAILRRARDERGVSDRAIDHADTSLLRHDQEKRLVFHLAQYPAVVEDASRLLSVNLIAEFAYHLATTFSQFYRDCPVLDAELELRDARLQLVRTVRDVLANACDVLGVPVIERL